jgi:hypothetical protein
VTEWEIEVVIGDAQPALHGFEPGQNRIELALHLTDNRRVGEAAVSVAESSRGSTVSLASETGRLTTYVWHLATIGHTLTLVQSNQCRPL